MICVDVCAAFAASFLIRIARLFPNELNLKKTAKDVEELAGILSEGELYMTRICLRRRLKADIRSPCWSIRSFPTAYLASRSKSQSHSRSLGNLVTQQTLGSITSHVGWQSTTRVLAFPACQSRIPRHTESPIQPSQPLSEFDIVQCDSADDERLAE